MHDPDGPTPKPASTWGNTVGTALHNIYYRTSASGLPEEVAVPSLHRGHARTCYHCERQFVSLWDARVS